MGKTKKTKKSSSKLSAKRLWPGFEQTRALKFGGPKVDKATLRYYPLVPNSNLAHDVLTFSFTTGPHELVRFLPQPIRVQYFIKGKPPAGCAANNQEDVAESGRLLPSVSPQRRRSNR